jgi:hypothetical protein
MTIQIEKTELLTILAANVALVSFTKKDGTVRNMKCTLKESLLPIKDVAEGAKTRTPSTTDSIAVFDTEKEAWRSFNLGNVISFETLI